MSKNKIKVSGERVEIFFTNELLSEHVEWPKTKITRKILNGLTEWRNFFSFNISKEINSPLPLRTSYVNCVSYGQKFCGVQPRKNDWEEKYDIRPEFFADTRTRLQDLCSKVFALPVRRSSPFTIPKIDNFYLHVIRGTRKSWKYFTTFVLFPVNTFFRVCTSYKKSICDAFAKTLRWSKPLSNYSPYSPYKNMLVDFGSRTPNIGKCESTDDKGNGLQTSSTYLIWSYTVYIARKYTKSFITGWQSGRYANIRRQRWHWRFVENNFIVWNALLDAGRPDRQAKKCYRHLRRVMFAHNEPLHIRRRWETSVRKTKKNPSLQRMSE